MINQTSMIPRYLAMINRSSPDFWGPIAERDPEIKLLLTQGYEWATNATLEIMGGKKVLIDLQNKYGNNGIAIAKAYDPTGNLLLNCKSLWYINADKPIIVKGNE